MKSHNISSDKHGFTLIEILVVVALLAAILGFGIIMSFSSISQANVHHERDQVAMLLTSARAKSLANVNETAHGLRVTSTSYILFDAPFVGGAPTNKILPRGTGITVVSSLAPGDCTTCEVVFEQLSGKVATAQSLTLSDTTKTVLIELNQAGRIDW